MDTNEGDSVLIYACIKIFIYTYTYLYFVWFSLRALPFLFVVCFHSVDRDARSHHSVPQETQRPRQKLTFAAGDSKSDTITIRAKKITIINVNKFKNDFCK